MRGYTSYSSIYPYIITHFFRLCKCFLKKNNFFYIFFKFFIIRIIFCTFIIKNALKFDVLLNLINIVKKVWKNPLTSLDICDKIVNCIIIAYYALFATELIEYIGKNQVDVELRSNLFRFYLYTRGRRKQK